MNAILRYYYGHIMNSMSVTDHSMLKGFENLQIFEYHLAVNIGNSRPSMNHFVI